MQLAASRSALCGHHEVLIADVCAAAALWCSGPGRVRFAGSSASPAVHPLLSAGDREQERPELRTSRSRDASAFVTHGLSPDAEERHVSRGKYRCPAVRLAAEV